VPTYRYPRPAVTVDVVLFALHDGALRVPLIQRAAPPFAGRWALPGGFVDEDEDLAAAALRELAEETHLRPRRLVQLGAYGTPGRDPRGHTVSVVFLGVATDEREGTAGDDARALRWFAAARPPGLAFDHRVVLRDAVHRFAELARERAAFVRAFLGPGRHAGAEALRRAARAARGGAA
jgi:8-oxo-dGTP diphosphatase